jgi:hypothetical protein
MEASLKRAFVDHEADYIIVDNLHHRFLIASAQFGVAQGWLSEKLEEPPPWPSQDGGQLEYRLTDEGKKHFGVK